jgi:hypothetical protein
LARSQTNTSVINDYKTCADLASQERELGSNNPNGGGSEQWGEMLSAYTTSGSMPPDTTWCMYDPGGNGNFLTGENGCSVNVHTTWDLIGEGTESAAAAADRHQQSIVFEPVDRALHGHVGDAVFLGERGPRRKAGQSVRRGRPGHAGSPRLADRATRALP